MTFIRRLMEIKERQLVLEEAKQLRLADINLQLHEILEVLKGRKDGKRKISRKNLISYRG